MTDLTFDHLYPYAELTDALHGLAAAHPDLLELDSAGQSHEGREIWLATITNRATGPHHEKPALFVEANIHATEITASTAALHLIHHLVTHYGHDEAVTRALDTRVAYVIARLNPDGVEMALASPPTYLRSSTRTYPRPDQQPGLVEQDIDGDGRILTMRVPDPNGAWKIHPDDARLLVPRALDEVGPGPFYRILPEGTIHEYDGVLVPIAPAHRGLDLNRNFPQEWLPEGDQHGSGPYPTSEPEVRALVEAIVARKNITSYIGYHTFSGVHLRPWSGHSDDDFPVPDLRAFKLMGEEATRITGYSSISIFHDFKYHPKMVIKGGDVDWIYDHLGAYAWVTEFWSPQRAAGLSEYHFIDWLREHSPEDELAVLKVADEVGEGYVDWYPFEHPQLGPVEIGGWDLVRFWFNPPLSRLEEEVKPHADFALYLALIAPVLEIRSFESEPVAAGAFRLRLVLENAGWLPTNVTEKALERKAVRPVEVELEIPDGARIASGKKREEAGQLGGRVERRQVNWWGTDHSTAERTLVEWVVEAKAGDRVGVVARHERAGTVRAELVL